MLFKYIFLLFCTIIIFPFCTRLLVYKYFAFTLYHFKAFSRIF